jgi:hypothetical protein
MVDTTEPTPPTAGAAPAPDTAPGGGRKFTFASGGWVIALGIAIGIAAAAVQIAQLRPVGPGDGKTIESYGFDLTGLTPEVRAQLAPTPLPRDYIEPLDDPATMSPEDERAVTRAMRGKYLVSSDLVIGLVIGDAACAYPIRIVGPHRIVNAELGGVPILVVYDPVAGTAVAHDRRVAGRTREFGVSGLVRNGSVVVYDRAADPAVDPGSGASLWCTLTGDALAGPAATSAAGSTGRLTTLAGQLVRWTTWLRQHPDTQILASPEIGEWVASNRRWKPVIDDRYKDNPLGDYETTDRLLYPVAPPLRDGVGDLKERVTVIGVRGSTDRIVVDETALTAGPVRRELAGTAVVITADGRGADVTPAEPLAGLTLRHSYRFAAASLLGADSAADPGN